MNNPQSFTLWPLKGYSKSHNESQRVMRRCQIKIIVKTYIYGKHFISFSFYLCYSSYQILTKSPAKGFYKTIFNVQMCSPEASQMEA